MLGPRVPAGFRSYGFQLRPKVPAGFPQKAVRLS